MCSKLKVYGNLTEYSPTKTAPTLQRPEPTTRFTKLPEEVGKKVRKRWPYLEEPVREELHEGRVSVCWACRLAPAATVRVAAPTTVAIEQERTLIAQNSRYLIKIFRSGGFPQKQEVKENVIEAGSAVALANS